MGATVSGDAVAIEIEDTGSGMSAEFIRDRLFRPFDSTKGAQGMGIGAYQVRETLRAVGGEVVVNSSPGQGTTMTLKLPVAAPSLGRTRQAGIPTQAGVPTA